MSNVIHRTEPGKARDEARGQSLVEFALLLPLLMVIVLGVVDFGRVFQAGIVMESATRAAAEAGAVEYLREVNSGAEPNYELIHKRAAEVACREAKLANVDPGTCAQWPVIRVCIHDLAAGHVGCGQPAHYGTGSALPDCPQTNFASASASSALAVPPTDANTTPREAYVEVRTCYRFTTLIPVSEFLPLGELFLQREATFTVADY
jgi:hypothetical protein